jgi:hypothetical protein
MTIILLKITIKDYLTEFIQFFITTELRLRTMIKDYGTFLNSKQYANFFLMCEIIFSEICSIKLFLS